jgi:hypothetical protein
MRFAKSFNRAELIHRIGRWPVPIVALVIACLIMTATVVWGRQDEPKAGTVNVASAAKGVRVSKLRGATVSNGTEKIGTLDDLTVSPNQSLSAVTDVGHYVGDDRYVVVPFNSLQIEGHGARIVLPGATRFKYAED